MLADEPTGNLDSKVGDEIMQILTTLNVDRHVTVVMVTHDAHCAAFAQHWVVFRDGRVVTTTRKDAVS